MRKLLLAVCSASLPIMVRALDKEFELVPCLTLAAAREALLVGGIDLIIASIYFDESRMFNLLRYAQADPITQSIPFICMNIVDDHIAPTFIQSAEIASQALGARLFLDLSEWRRRFNDTEAYEQLQSLIRAQINKAL